MPDITSKPVARIISDTTSKSVSDVRSAAAIKDDVILDGLSGTAAPGDIILDDASVEDAALKDVMSEDAALDIEAIRAVLPHRYPFLLVDRIIERVGEQRIVGLKNVTANEPFFQGHFPGKPVMPGVLIVEALAQAGAVLVLSKPENRGKIALFAGIDNCRFKRQVVPGDRLTLEIEVIRLKGIVGKCSARALVEGELACAAELMFIIDK